MQREDRQLKKTLDQVQNYEYHDLYENIDMRKFNNITPNKKSLLNLDQNQNSNNNPWGQNNFVNFKQFQQVNQRQVKTAMKNLSDAKPKLDHQSLYPYINNNKSEKSVHFSIGTPQQANFQPNVKSMAKTLLFENSTDDDEPNKKYKTLINQEAKGSLIRQRILTHNNYSAMLSTIQKKRKFDQLQNRFQQTINMLPDEAKQQLIHLTKSINQEEDSTQKQLYQELQSSQYEISKNTDTQQVLDLYDQNILKTDISKQSPPRFISQPRTDTIYKINQNKSCFL